jgi:hypothetical protein
MPKLVDGSGGLASLRTNDLVAEEFWKEGEGLLIGMARGRNGRH